MFIIIIGEKLQFEGLINKLEQVGTLGVKVEELHKVLGKSS